MKRIRVYGCLDKPKLKKEIREAASLFIQDLLPRKRKYDITITISSDLSKKVGSFGECWSWSRNEYTVKIDGSQTKKNIFKTLAHEFVHVKQFSVGELKFLTKFDVWQGTVYYHGAKYESLPWEKEANRYEKILYNKHIVNKRQL
jgi:hypothetical protein